MERVEIKDRLRELCDFYGIKPIDIAKKTGLPKSSLSLYLSGQRIPRQDKIALITEAYGIDPGWLMGYDIPMRPQMDQVAENGFILGKLAMDDKTIQMVKDFYELPKEKQEYVYRTIEMLKETK